MLARSFCKISRNFSRSGTARFATTSVPVSEVKKLRERTGAPLSECREALLTSNNDMTLALEFLRKKGVSVAAKRSGKVSAQGLIAVRVDSNSKSGALVELNSETDFVARNPQFSTLIANIAQAAHGLSSTGSLSVPELLDAKYPGGTGKVGDAVTQFVATTRENVQIRRAARVSVSSPSGVLGFYAHSSSPSVNSADGVTVRLGRIGSLVGLECAANSQPELLNSFANKFAMHVVGASPLYTLRTDIPSQVIEKEKEIYREQAMKAEKPPKNDEILNKMLEGRLSKFYAEVALMDQAFSIPDDNFPKAVSISQALKTISEVCKQKVEVSSWLRYQVGENLETDKKTDKNTEAVTAGTSKPAVASL
jgi:elongation factor Ts